MVMPVVQASEVRPSEHFIGTQHVKAALVQSQCALGWIACDSHDVNVATQKRTVKRSEPQQWFECWRRTMPCSMRSELQFLRAFSASHSLADARDEAD